MTAQERSITIDDFKAFVEQSANFDKRFELVGGEIVEVPSNPYVSGIAATIIFLLKLFLKQNGLKGHVTGEGGGYIVAGEVYAPDVAYLSAERQPELAKEGFNPIPPELAVEVVSSNRPDELNNLRIKISNYLIAGTIVWVVKPEIKQVEIHHPTNAVRILHEQDTLNGDTLLEGFSVKVSALFEG